VKLIKVGLRLRFFRVLVVYDLGEIAADHEQRRERLARCAEDTLAVVDCLRLGHTTITETMDTYGHLFPDAEDLGRGAIDAIFAMAPTEQERNQKTW
jgi:hypothetical protein